jgi:hypothetical protein
MVPKCEYGSSFTWKIRCRCIWSLPVSVYNDIHKIFVCLFSQNSEPEVLGETENVEVVRTFYTYRPTPKSDIDVWYADGEFGFYEGLPKRVAEMHATHVILEVRSESPSEPIPRRSDLFLCLFTCLVSEKVGYHPQGRAVCPHQGPGDGSTAAYMHARAHRKGHTRRRRMEG